ncbi:MAG TPA: IS66 family transposase zinc-finger binding domain-containing protein [Clostridia bacterium]|nr:IS66 family transposase zinc-finger binding domain-containing protein [Clostridia bacterium]
MFNKAEIFADDKTSEPQLEEVRAHYRKKSRELKDRLPEDLPVEAVEHRLPETEQLCAACGKIMQEIGKDVRRTLVIVPAQVKIREDWYFIYACQTCKMVSEETPVISTPKEAPVIAGSLAGGRGASDDAEVRYGLAHLPAGTGMAAAGHFAVAADDVQLDAAMRRGLAGARL